MSVKAYRDDIACPQCGSNWLPKAGFSRGKQTYRCGNCLYRFTPQGNRSYYPESVKRQVLKMYGEGMSMSAISRVMDVKLGTVFSWIKKSPSCGRSGEGGAGSCS